MAVLAYYADGERVEEDVLNRPLRQLLTDSGLDADASFPGFFPANEIVPPDYLGSGTRDGSKYLRDDGTWAALPASGLSGSGTTNQLAVWNAGDLADIAIEWDSAAKDLKPLANNDTDLGIVATKEFRSLAVFELLHSDATTGLTFDSIVSAGTGEIHFSWERSGTALMTLLGDGTLDLLDNVLLSPTIQDYSEVLVAHGNTTGAVNWSHADGNVHSGTLTGNTTITITNWPTSGIVGRITAFISGNGTATLGITNVDWGAAGAPATISSGQTLFVNLVTLDGGTNVMGGWARGYTI